MATTLVTSAVDVKLPKGSCEQPQSRKPCLMQRSVDPMNAGESDGKEEKVASTGCTLIVAAMHAVRNCLQIWEGCN